MTISILPWIRLGSPYELGYAHGQLMQEKANNMINDVWNYLEDQVVRLIWSMLCKAKT